jgi:hypothetical protein
MKPLVISFYTNDWEYSAHAVRLRQECQDLNLDHHIVELTSTGSYRGNCGLKPGFILQSLKKFKMPVLWLDVDASILRYPSELLIDSIHQYDIAAIRKKPGMNHWYVGSIWFNYTTNTLAFVNQWSQQVGTFADDGAFQLIYDQNQSDLKLFELNPVIHSIRVRGQPAIGPETCFSHRISRGEIKQKEKRLSRHISEIKNAAR